MSDLKNIAEKVDFYTLIKAIEYTAAFLQNGIILSKLANIVTKRRRTFFTTLSKGKVSKHLENVEVVSYKVLSFMQIFDYKDQFEDFSTQLRKILKIYTRNKNNLIIKEKNSQNEPKDFMRSGQTKKRGLIHILKLLIIISDIIGNFADTAALLSYLLLKIIYFKNKKLVSFLQNVMDKSEKLTDVFWSFSLLFSIFHCIIKLIIKQRVLNHINCDPNYKLQLKQDVKSYKWEIVLYSLDLLTSTTSAINGNNDDEKYEWTLLFSFFSAISSVIELVL